MGEEGLVCLKCGRVIQNMKTWGKHAKACGIPLPYDPDVLASAKESYKRYFRNKKTNLRSVPDQSKVEDEQEQATETEDIEDIDEEPTEEEEPKKSEHAWKCDECGKIYRGRKPKVCVGCGIEFE